MKLFAGWAVAAGLVLAASAANAQMLAPHDGAWSPYRAISDFDGPYSTVPPPPVPPAPPPDAYGAPPLLPVPEVYAVLRENGFQPLGIPYRRGFIYTISAIDPDGDDGQLVIDARSGRIIRFMPAYLTGQDTDEAPMGFYDGPQAALPPPPIAIRSVPRPPALIPHASRSVPLPAPKPRAARPVEPAQQSAAIQTRPAEMPGARQATGSIGEARPSAPVIRPTEPMPAVQGLE